MYFNIKNIKTMTDEEYDNFIKEYVEDYNNSIDNLEEYAIKKSEKGCLSVTDVLLTMIPLAMFGGHKMPSKMTEQEAREIFDYIKNNIEL
jgi:hypothetical protein